MSLDPVQLYLVEAPSSIDRSGNGSAQEDGETIEVGETLRLKNTTWVSGVPGLIVERPDGSIVETGPPTARWRFTPETAGRFEVRTPDGTEVASTEVESGPGNAGEETTGDTDDYVNTEEPFDPTDFAADTPGVVPSDNERGYEAAPAVGGTGSGSPLGGAASRAAAALLLLAAGAAAYWGGE